MQLVDNCVLAIIILDGFRPNIVFEFGMLKAKEKPIVIIKSHSAYINIKTLFQSVSESGSTEKQFSNLNNPRLSVFTHLSDYAGKHVATVKLNTSKKNSLNISNVIQKELEKKQDHIKTEIVNLSIRRLIKKEKDLEYMKIRRGYF